MSTSTAAFDPRFAGAVSAQSRRLVDRPAAPGTYAKNTAAGPDGTGRVTLVVSQARNEAVAVVGGLGSPGVDRTYQLWMVNGRRATNEGTLGTGAASGTVFAHPTDQSASPASA